MVPLKGNLQIKKQMSGKKIIFVSQEIMPYLAATPNSKLSREVPQKMQELKYEVRTFMPDFGTINERRNQLHEVIRLSGANFTIGDSDHPLVVKVASMQPSRIQVYFIDNDDYFQKLDSDVDAIGSNREDNDERMIFYALGTMETARKLRWEPDVVHVSGWMSALMPIYLKKLYSDGPNFKKTSVVYSIMPEDEIAELSVDFFSKLKEEGIKEEDLKEFESMPRNLELLRKMAIRHSDGVIFRGGTGTEELRNYCEATGIPYLELDMESHAEQLNEFYTSLEK